MVDGPAGPAVAAAIEARGPIGVDEFVRLALYEPELGFFASGRGAGRAGRDFLTSPEVGPLFGEVIAAALDLWWDELGRPDPFVVVDAGAGSGTLARGILEAGPVCGPTLDLVLVEISDRLRDRHPDGVRSQPAMPAEPFTGVVLANELLDNLPFGIAQADEDGWVEIRVGLDGDRLVEVVGPRLPAGAPAGLTLQAPGVRVPVQSAARRWVIEALRRLDSGRLVVLDYAATAAELAARGQDGWLRTYRDHRRGGGLLDAPGSQDLTADVSLDQLPAGGVVSTQADFLARFGIEDHAAEAGRIWRERAHLGDLVALAARSRVHEAETLTDPAGLGGFCVVTWDPAVESA